MSFNGPQATGFAVKNEPQDPPQLYTAPPAPQHPPMYTMHYPYAIAPQPGGLMARAKPEPTLEPPFPGAIMPRQPFSPIKPEAKPDIKPKLEFKHEPEPDRPVLPAATHNTYRSAGEINYTPENALEEGVEMAKTIGSYLKQIDLGSQLRKDVWLREVENLKSQGAPHTMIAVCGATGAGKSSLLNAVLD
ncbi:hypothetical protein FRC06_008636, partial [Ceratobasidium sp. 370]